MSAKRPLHAFHGWVLLLHWHGPKAVRGVTVASLARLAHGAWRAGDAGNALLAHRSSCTHLAIPWRTLRTWRGKSEKENQEVQATGRKNGCAQKHLTFDECVSGYNTFS